MSKFINGVENTMFVLFKIGILKIAMPVIVCVVIFRSCMGLDMPDIDDSITARREEFYRIEVVDSTGVGFELLWYTVKPVSKRRFEEMRTRQYLYDSYKRLKAEGAAHFSHDLINTDIYDFAAYAKTFDLDSTEIRLVNVFVYGKRYEDLYRRPHPDYPDGVNIMDKLDDIGVLFIKEDEVYPYSLSVPRKYRYWGCEAVSATDERHTHITEWDRKRSSKR